MRSAFIAAVGLGVLTCAGYYTLASQRPRSSIPPYVPKHAPKSASSGSRTVADILNEARAELRRYRGVKVDRTDFDGHPRGPALEQVASRLEADDFVPDRRAEHFAWLADYKGVLTGWTARIIDMKATPMGTLVFVRITPQHTGGVDRINDYVDEQYLFRNGRLEFQGLEEAQGPFVTTFN